MTDTGQRSPQGARTGSRSPLSRVAAPAKGATPKDDRLIRRPNAAHALRAHLAEVLQTPAAVPAGGIVVDARAIAFEASRPDGPSRKARDIAAGVRSRSAGFAHLFDPVAPTNRASELLDRTGSVRPVLGAADLGSLVRQVRETLGQSQAVFASSAGVGRRFLSELEAGKSTLEFDKVLAVCRAAGIVVLAGLAHGG